MFNRIFGKRKSESINRDRMLMLQIDYIGGYFDGLSKSADHTPRTMFWAAAFKVLNEHGLEKKGGSLDFPGLPAPIATELSLLHSAILGEPAAAEAAMRSLDPAWYLTIRSMKQRADGAKAAATSATQSEATRVSEQIDLVEVLGDLRGRRSSAALLDWLKLQPPDPDLWHDIATNADPDGMDDVFEWIVRQRDCDAATAAHIFHVSNAFDLYKFRDEKAAGMYAPAFRTVVTIIDRWREGSFPTARFSFDPDNDPEAVETYDSAARKVEAWFGRAPFHVPKDLLERRQGEPTRSRYFFSGQGTRAEYLQTLARRAG